MGILQSGHMGAVRGGAVQRQQHAQPIRANACARRACTGRANAWRANARADGAEHGAARWAAQAFTPAEPYHQHFWAKGRLKLGLLVALLLLRGAGSSQLSLAADVGTQLVLLWWFVECFGLLAAASPFAELF